MHIELETSEERAQYQAATPEMEDARRRLALTLRALAERREKEERDRTDVELWARELEREIRAYRRWRIERSVRKVARAGLIVLFIYLMIRHHGSWWFWWMLPSAAVADRAAASRKQAALALARARDPRAVSVLAIACREGDRDTREVATQGLVGILPRLAASDAQYVTSQGMQALIDLLNRRDVDLVEPIVTALAQVGDARAIPAVTALRVDTQTYLVRREERLQQIDDCLAAIKARAEQERMRQTLLRPAEAPQDAGAYLLRPASGASDIPQEQLLRPVE